MKSEGHHALQGTKIIALSATTETLFKKNGGGDFYMFSKCFETCIIGVVVEKPVALMKLIPLLNQ